MEGRIPSKTTRSYRGAPKSLRSSQTLTSSGPVGHPHSKERVKSAPVGIPLAEAQQLPRGSQQIATGSARGDSLHLETGTRLVGSLSPDINQYAVPSHQYITPAKVYISTIKFAVDIFADIIVKLERIQEVNLAVSGAPAVGKSTFVHCALDLKEASTASVFSKKVSLEDKFLIIRLLEVGFDDMEIAADHSLHWPEKVGDQETPNFDGVFVLYDVMDQSSIAQIPALLSESVRSSRRFSPAKQLENLDTPCFPFKGIPRIRAEAYTRGHL